jgi:ABC-type multidrug transport system fused ATPase/permease subunit
LVIYIAYFPVMNNPIGTIWKILDGKEKKRAYMLIFVSILTNIFDLIGISSIIPFIGMLANPSIIQENQYLSSIYSYFDFQSNSDFIMVMAWCVLAFIMLTSIFQAIAQSYAFFFAEMQRKNISSKILKHYIHQDFDFFTKNSPSTLTKNILSEVDTVVTRCITPFVLLVTASIQAVIVISLIVYIEPYVALSSFAIISVIFILLYILLKKKILSYGTKRVKENTKRYAIVNDVLGAIKDIKINHLENTYSKIFEDVIHRFCTISAKNESLTIIPRYSVQMIVFGGMIFLLIISLARYGSIEMAMPTLALFAIAGIKIIPAFYMIYNNLAKIRFGTASLNILEQELKFVSLAQKTVQLNTNDMIPFNDNVALSNVTFKYPDTDNIILNNLSLSIKANKTIGIIGTSGSGKTTLIDIILGLYDLGQGHLKIDDKFINRENKHQWQNSIGFVPQDIFLSDKTILENIAFGCKSSEIDRDRVTNAAKNACLHNFIINDLEDGYHTRVGDRGTRLSGGQRQRIGIARALYKNAPVLILDEATSAIDNVTESEIIRTLDALHGQKTIIMIAHRLDTVKNCDIIHIMEKGKVVDSGSYDDLKKNSKIFKKILGQDNE